MCDYCGVDEEKCKNAVCSRGITDQKDIDAILKKHNDLRRRVAKGEEIEVSVLTYFSTAEIQSPSKRHVLGCVSLRPGCLWPWGRVHATSDTPFRFSLQSMHLNLNDDIFLFRV